MEKGVLNSDFPEAKQALEAAISCSYWVSVQSRVKSQFVVMNKDNQTGYIIPQMVVAGTVTGRAVESTWLTASNSKKNRIGSEIKTTIRIPEGYLQIGADVDS
jgi:DNA polymerase gamma 1